MNISLFYIDTTNSFVTKYLLFLRGYNILPENPVNIIDFHGLHDRTIPFSKYGPDNLGEGPDDTVIASDGFYYHDKMIHLTNVLNR